MSKLLDIAVNPNPLLRQKAEKIEPEEIKKPEFKQLCQDMARTMKEKDGIGLAAPQIGQSIRLVVIASIDGVQTLINPEIIRRSWRKENGEEGCLSLPGLFGFVQRHKNIVCRFIDATGKTRTISAQGMMARVIQHELDHLDGILFIDKAKKISQIKDQPKETKS